MSRRVPKHNFPFRVIKRQQLQLTIAFQWPNQVIKLKAAAFLFLLFFMVLIRAHHIFKPQPSAVLNLGHNHFVDQAPANFFRYIQSGGFKSQAVFHTSIRQGDFYWL